METFAFLQNLNGWEIFLIFFAILLLFGAKRLPELARGMGKSVREFRKATHEVEENFREAMDQEPAATAKPAAAPAPTATAVPSTPKEEPAKEETSTPA